MLTFCVARLSHRFAARYCLFADGSLRSGSSSASNCPAFRRIISVVSQYCGLRLILATSATSPQRRLPYTSALTAVDKQLLLASLPACCSVSGLALFSHYHLIVLPVTLAAVERIDSPTLAIVWCVRSRHPLGPALRT